jgi:hypothetical protein
MYSWWKIQMEFPIRNYWFVVLNETLQIFDFWKRYTFYMLKWFMNPNLGSLNVKDFIWRLKHGVTKKRGSEIT